MYKCCETLLVVMMCLGPVVILVSVMQQYGPLGVAAALIFSGIYVIMVMAGLVINRWCKEPGGDLSVITTRDDEDVQVTQHDSPPSYDVVVDKPPPYDLLNVSNLPTYGDVIGHVPIETTININNNNNNNATVNVPLHHQPLLQEPYHKMILPWTVTQPDPCPPPPSYSPHVVVILCSDTKPLGNVGVDPVSPPQVDVGS